MPTFKTHFTKGTFSYDILWTGLALNFLDTIFAGGSSDGEPSEVDRSARLNMKRDKNHIVFGAFLLLKLHGFSGFVGRLLLASGEPRMQASLSINCIGLIQGL